MGNRAGKKYLLCPLCDLHRFFVTDKDRGNIYFHVDLERKPFPTEASNADLAGLDFSVIGCTGCSWKGSLRNLVRVFRY